MGIDEAAYGPDHPDVSTDLTNLATTWHDLGQLERALPLAERALGIGRDLNNLAAVLYGLGQLERGRPLAQRALVNTEATYGSDHPTERALRVNLQAYEDH